MASSEVMYVRLIVRMMPMKFDDSGKTCLPKLGAMSGKQLAGSVSDGSPLTGSFFGRRLLAGFGGDT
jgi:hypothetical protein